METNIQLIESFEYTPGFYLKDSINWMLVSIVYKAKGGEHHLSIGRYKQNHISDTNHLSITDTLADTLGFTLGVSGNRWNGAGYFIDDVFVIPSKDYAPGISKAKFEKGKSIT